MQTDKLTIKNFRVRAVNVPMKRPLATASGSIGFVPLVLLDLETDQGITGRSYVFTVTPLALQATVHLLQEMLAVVKGDGVAPFNLEQKLQQRFRLLGLQGLVYVALSAIDMAAWDALAQAQGLPLVKLLGGQARPVKAYNSCGLGLMGKDKVAAQALELLEDGFAAMKVRLGYATLREDIEVLRAVRQAVGDGITLMCDYNQGLTPTEALVRCRALDGEGLHWIEEPILADDYAGNALIARDIQTPIQIGENFWGPHDMHKALAAQACDYAMPDLMRIGGVSGWMRAAALAESAGMPMSSHLFPEVSAHLLAVTPTGHWLEYVDWAAPVLAEPLVIKNGHAVIPDRPGNGMAWDEAAVSKYLAGTP
jgi:mandelate racemase